MHFEKESSIRIQHNISAGKWKDFFFIFRLPYGIIRLSGPYVCSVRGQKRQEETDNV